MKQQIINVSGGYWSGSSTVINILQECKDIYVFPVEYSCFGFGQSFTNELEDKFVQDIFVNFHRKENLQIIRKSVRYLLRKINLFPRWLFLPRMNGKEFFGQAYNSYIDKLDLSHFRGENRGALFSNLIDAMFSDVGADTIVLDQAISSSYINFINDSRILNVVVTRCPLDQFVELKPFLYKMVKRNHSLKLKPLGEELNMDEDVLRMFCSMRRQFDERLYHLKNSNNTLILEFEDIVLNYERTKSRLFTFLDIDSVQHEPFAVFKPNESAKNIGKWRGLLTSTEIRYLCDACNISI